MGKFSLYNIPLKTLTDGVHNYEYKLDDSYFKLIDDVDSDIKKGSIEVWLKVKRLSSTFEFDFLLNGHVTVPCDRCLDDMSLDVDTANRLIVKFGESYSEESDEIVIIPEEEGEINIAWFLYEFITLFIPIKHVHPAGSCNKAMTIKYNKYRATERSDEDGMGDEDAIGEENIVTDIDPRWDVLRGLSVEDEE